MLPKCDPVKYRGKLGKLLDCDIAECTVSRKNNKYYASIIFKDVPIQLKPRTGKSIGLDWGEKILFTSSEGIKFSPSIKFDLNNNKWAQQKTFFEKISF